MKHRLEMILVATALLAAVPSLGNAQNAQADSSQIEQLPAMAQAHRVAMRIEHDTLTIRGTVSSAAEKRKLERELRTFWPDGPVRSHLAVDAGRGS